MTRMRWLVSILLAACAGAWMHTACAGDVVFSTGERFDARGGEALYRSICQGCHMPDGRGATGAGTYPSLAANPRLANGVYPASVVLTGRRAMPPFADVLDDAQVADVVDYVRTHFGNRHPERIDAARVHEVRPSR